MTLVEQRARSASMGFGVGAPPPASAARTRARASVMRAGVLPVAMRPNFGAGGAATSPARIAMRNNMPRGANVQRAAQSMKSRSAGRSGGQSRTSAIGLRLPPPADCLVAHTTPVARRAPSGMRTKAPGSSFALDGRAIAIGGVDGDGRQHVDHHFR